MQCPEGYVDNSANQTGVGEICIPELFSYNSSTQAASYLTYDVTINGESVDSEDWVAAFNGDICIGARKWNTEECNNGICDIPVNGYEVFSPHGDLGAVTFPQTVWSDIEKVAFTGKIYHSGTKSFVLNYLKKYAWRLEIDEDAIQLLTKVVKETVPDRYTLVNAGDRIIDQGEKVTPRHQAMVNALKRILNEKRNLWHPLTILGTLILTLVFHLMNIL